jgi:hypothetical protein
MNVDRSKSLEDLEDGYWGDHPDQIGELDKIVVKVSVLETIRIVPGEKTAGLTLRRLS